MSTNTWPKLNINAAELGAVIASAKVDKSHLDSQRRLVAAYQGRTPNAQENWDTAVESSASLDLPVGFYVVGNSLEGQRIVMLYVILTAPLDLAVAAFKRARRIQA